MAFLTETEKRDIANAIRDAESGSKGEIVTVVARSADRYLFIPTLWASVLALLAPAPLLILEIGWSSLKIYEIQLAIFIGITLLFRWPPITMRLIPGAVKRQRAARLAREQFILQGLTETSGRTGILIFVSVAEHYVEIIADKGINDLVPPDTWSKIVEGFIGEVKAGRTAAGFQSAIEACGKVLTEHVPSDGRNADELPNHLIEI